MSKKQTKGIKPNMIDSAEMKALIAMYPNAKLGAIKVAEHNKTGYNFIGLKAEKTSGVGYKISVKQFVKSPTDWEEMTEEVKKRAFAQFDEVKMIHSPILVSNSQKKQKEPTEKELLVEEAKELELETKGLTIPQLKEAIANKKADSDEASTVD